MASCPEADLDPQYPQDYCQVPSGPALSSPAPLLILPTSRKPHCAPFLQASRLSFPSPHLVNFYSFFSIQLFVPLGKEGAPVCKKCALTGLLRQKDHSLWAFHLHLPGAGAHPAQAATRGNYLEGTKDAGP